MFIFKKKVCELKSEYEKENSFKYDWVIFCRFDNNRTEIDRSYNLLSSLDLNKINNENVYVEYRKNRKDKDETYYDLWFLSNSKNANIYSSCFDNRFKYCIFNVYSAREHIDSNIDKKNITLLS